MEKEKTRRDIVEANRKLIHYEIVGIDGASTQTGLVDMDGTLACCGFVNIRGPSIVGNNPSRN